MPLTPDPPFPKSQGDTLRAKDWNVAVNEIIRLDKAKLNLTGGHVTGPLQIDGPLGIGTATPDHPLTIQSSGGTSLNLKGNNGTFEVMVGADSGGGILSTVTNHDLQLRAGSNSTKLIIKADGKVGVGTQTPEVTLHVSDVADIGPFAVRPGEAAPGRLMVTGSVAEVGFTRRDLTAWPATPAAGDRYLWYSPDGSARFWTEARGDLLTIGPSGDVVLTGNFTLPKSAGTAMFTGNTYANENTFHPNNLKLQMVNAGLIFRGGETLQYEFAIGHLFTSFVIGGGPTTSFVKRFSINENGELFCAGSKAGYVVDFCLNRGSQPFEQGDVVVVVESDGLHYYGTNHDIPIVEVDLTDQVYDHRVCGIVSQHVKESDLPGIDWSPTSEAEAANPPTEHPLLRFAAPMEEQPNRRVVGERRLGKMATLGAFAHCKVDADIAPIQAGDLLTTSPTRGHAQKVLEEQKALGTIVGKALGPLARGKGKIPVLVMLQ